MVSVFGLMSRMDTKFGRYLILEQNPPLTSKNLVGREYTMLQKYDVPRLLPIEFDDIDGQIALRYRLSELRTLSSALPGFTLDADAAARLLHTITVHLEESKMYLLSDRRYSLDPETIFVGKDLTDLYFLYVPVASSEADKSTVLSRFLRLADYLAGFLPRKESERYFKLLFQLKLEHSSLQMCKMILLDAASALNRAVEEEISEPPIRMAVEPVLSGAAEESVLKIQQPESENASVFVSTFIRFLSSARFKLALSVCIAFAVMAWGFHFQFTSIPGLHYVASGFTLLALDGFYIKRKARTNPATVMDFEAAPLIEHSELTLAEHYSSLSLHTTMLTPHMPVGATMLLSDSSKFQEAAFLEREGEPGMEQIPLAYGSYIIGRDQQEAQRQELSTGVSRKHLELIRTENGCSARDLGSKNGSLLNGSPMHPLEKYPLSDGDVLEIADIRYVFRLSVPAAF